MTVTALPSVHLYSMGFSEKCLRHAVNIEAERAYRSIFCRSLRFSNFLPPNILTSCVRSKHKFSRKLLNGVDGYEKESVLIGCCGLDEFIGNRERFHEHIKAQNIDFDATLACKQFSSITLGCFPTVDLYDGPACYSQTTEPLVPEILEGCIPSRLDANWVDPKSLFQNLNSFYTETSNVTDPYVLEEESDKSAVYSEPPNWKTEPRNSLQLTADKPCNNAASVAEILDKCISCIPGLSKRQLSQLENSGFHTFRKLLHHFPRTYADLQNADVEIDDGQYLIFVGEIMSSRLL